MKTHINAPGKSTPSYPPSEADDRLSETGNFARFFIYIYMKSRLTRPRECGIVYLVKIGV